MECTIAYDNHPISYCVFTGPDTLLPNEHCIYGGTFVYSRTNATNLEEVFAICRKDKEVETLELFDIKDEEVVVAVIAFHQYSLIDERTYIARGIPDSAYGKQVKNCNSKKVCELSVSFSGDFSPNTHTYMVHVDKVVQYIGMSDFSTKIEFSQIAPAYIVYFTSSICYTPPNYCTCVTLHLDYSIPVSHFVREANYGDKAFMPSSDTNLYFLSAMRKSDGYDITFASSLSVNLSECEGRYPRIWWLLIFKSSIFKIFLKRILQI